MGKVICITGIDTGIGKTIATGLLGKYLCDQGYTTITQKICQTGCHGISTDIVVHRTMMGIDLVAEDHSGLTCPFVFGEPASPHLAAKLENTVICLKTIARATSVLQARYDYVLLEGVGGLMVPLNRQTLLVDYLKGFAYEHILVSCSRLGSLHHTLSAFEILHSRGISLNGLVYNKYFTSSKHITDDSRQIFFDAMGRYGHRKNIVDISTYEYTHHKPEKLSILL